MTQFYVAVALVVLAVVAFLVTKVKKVRKQKKITTPAALAFFLIIAGIVFGENRLVGYVLIGSGVVFALIDIKKGFK